MGTRRRRALEAPFPRYGCKTCPSQLYRPLRSCAGRVEYEGVVLSEEKEDEKGNEEGSSGGGTEAGLRATDQGADCDPSRDIYRHKSRAYHRATAECLVCVGFFQKVGIMYEVRGSQPFSFMGSAFGVLSCLSLKAHLFLHVMVSSVGLGRYPVLPY